ncbi:hypothetical protein C2E20_5054 [Micractinium conductrix]|uniref:Cytochrome c domain-containing protein n=1 Tax=Micractinium conductrix TaxID=554055 RepID=A0A2P6VBY7_9CHLO|nr:hypothetical protein C2E20_5054 [Micractinium conductrix]|eukprot:PSC71599.1 hypothetical protein C2E20_5054 [Micractinium conductrix]
MPGAVASLRLAPAVRCAPQARRLPCTASSSSFNTTALPLADLRRHAAAAALGAALLAGGAAPSFAAAPDLQLGAEVFQNSCAACHTGGLNNIAGEEKHTLKRDALEKYKLYSTDAIEGQVMSGKDAMPAFEGVLSQQEIQAPGCWDGRKISAVDKGLGTIDALPERYADVKTLYLSKNSLRSLAGVQQFRGLKALSAADNLLPDLECLAVLPAAGIQLEAASFEGNPLADLPHYRAHAIHTLGPSLAVLDNRTVTAEERAAAPGAVGHEATMLALMLSNACLVHKLGRAVQLVRLHCELQAAVLGGRGGGVGGAGVACSGRGTSRMLQLWDYEASMGRQERHAIGLAIRREVGRRYRKLLAAGGKPEGSVKLWQQAFAQVMLLQQETIAGLMGLLEEAKASAAASLAPLVRPPSPTKRAVLESEAEAQGRLRHDREVLIQELRDAFLGLAEAAAHSDATAELESRIRGLQAALEAAGADGLPAARGLQAALEAAGAGRELAVIKEGQGGRSSLNGTGESGGSWAIGALRPEASAPPSSGPAHTPRRASASPLKSALKQQQRPSSSGWSPARTSSGGAAPAPAPRPASARPGVSHAASVGLPAAPQRPSTASAIPQQQQQVQQQAVQQQRQWQADDGLAEYEEQARCKTPRPFSAAASSEAAPQQGLVMPTASILLPREGSSLPRAMAARPASAPLNGPWRPPSPQPARPGSPPLPGSTSRPFSPSQWTANPLARHSTTGGGAAGSGSPTQESGSPRQGLQGVFKLLEREGRLNQLDALKAAVGRYETAAAELQAGNHELSEALSRVHRHARGLEGQLEALAVEAAEREAAAAREAAEHEAALVAEAAAAREAAEAAAVARLAQLEELGGRLQEAMASRLALQAQLEAAVAEKQRLLDVARAEQEAAAAAAAEAQVELAAACLEAAQERKAAEAREAALAARVAQLEAQHVVQLSLTVRSHEEEWAAESRRAAALEARAAELSARVAAYQQRDERDAAAARLSQRATLRRILLWWRDAAAASACLGAKRCEAGALHRRTLLTAWLAKWQLATQRSQLLAEREAWRQAACLRTAWDAWRLGCHECVLRRGLDSAAEVHRQAALQRQVFGAWRERVAACAQVDLPEGHAALRAAATLQRRRRLRSYFTAWRQHITECVLPRQAAVQLRLLEQFMGSQRRALTAWQQYLQHRREVRMLKATSQQHLARRLLCEWRRLAAEAKSERTDALRGAVTNQLLLRRRGWTAWRLAVAEKKQRHEAQAAAEQHRRATTLRHCWAAWQEWTVLCRGMRQRRAARLQAAVVYAWRGAARAAEKRRLADACAARAAHRRFCSSLAAWRGVVAAKRAQRHQVAHARALLARRMMSRVLSGWRRAALAGKLYHTLSTVQQLQVAVERAREELEHKSQQIETLQSVRFTVEGESESLSLQVSSLDADLASAQRQAASLAAAVESAKLQHRAAAVALEAALGAKEDAEAEGAAAVAERAAALAARVAAESEKAAACRARQTAEQRASEAATRADEAAAAVAAAQAKAQAAAAEGEALTLAHQALAAQLAQVQDERQALTDQLEAAEEQRQALEAQLQAAQGEARRAAARANELDRERQRLRRQREQAEAALVTAATEQQAALKQAERLTQLCEEQQQQGDRLQAQLAHLQATMAGHSMLQADAAQLAEHNKQLLADSRGMRGQLETMTAAAHHAEGVRAALQAAAEATEAEQQRLRQRCQAAEEEAQRLGRLTEGLRISKAALERQLEAAQAAAGDADCRAAGLADELAAVQGERGELGEQLSALQAERAELQATVGQLRDQLAASNEVLESCRRLLGECCSARTASDQQAASLSELLRGVKAELMLKNASIKSLTRENAQRAEHLRALQAQVDALAALEASAAAPAAVAATSAYQLQGGARARDAMPASSGATSWAGSAGRRPSSAVLGSPSAGLRTAALYDETPSVGGRAYSPRTLRSLAAAVPASGGDSGATASSWPEQPRVHQQQRQQDQHQHQQEQEQQFSVPAALPSFITLPSPPAWRQQASSSPAGSAHSSAGSAALAQVLPQASSAGAAAAPFALPASMSLELSDQRLSYLLDLVVERRVTAAQAQQAINAAAEGDARPLLRMLSAVRGDTPSPVRPASAAGLPMPSPAASVSAAELAAVRNQIQQLQQRAQGGA